MFQFSVSLLCGQSYYPNPASLQHWFGLLRVRSPLLAQSLLFSSPMGTKMFQFPTFAFCLKQNDTASLCRVPPFGHLGIDGYLHLPQAFRSLSRPSSPPRAKASTVRSFLLFYFFARFVFTTSFLFLQTCQRSSLGFPALSSLFPPFLRRVIPLSYLSLSWLKIFFSPSPLCFSASFLSLSSLLFTGDSSPFSSSAAETRSLQRFLFLFFSQCSTG